MTRTLTCVIVAARALATSMLVSSPAHADERTCRGTIGATTVDNLRVPQGAVCKLNGTTVKGTITVQARATLRAERVRVVGNVQSENARRVVVRGSSVGGSIQHVQGGSAEIRNNRVEGGRADVPQRREDRDHRQPDRRQPAVQVKLPGPHWWSQPGRWQQGRSVPQALTAACVRRRTLTWAVGAGPE
jgi:hypothetical protein